MLGLDVGLEAKCEVMYESIELALKNRKISSWRESEITSMQVFNTTCPILNSPSSAASVLFAQFLTTIVSRQCEIGNVKYPRDRATDILFHHVNIDFIVVGSGSSGSVVASRISEISNWNVLLIEAGAEPSTESYIPSFAFSLQKTSIDWAYVSEKQPGVCEGLQNQVCNIPRGKALGGSSNLNIMLYVVGNPNDYNSWGSRDWTFDSIEKYFHKSFKDYYYAGLTDEDTMHHKKDFMDLIDQAGKQRNIRVLNYTNGNINPNKVGILHLKTNIKNGERLNIAKAFLAPIRDRPNLFLMKNTIVTKILFDNRKATGVQILRDGKYYEIRFNKELIVSAGAVNTPKLLFQSGIGDEKQLKRENMDVKLNMPSVGNYLYDHPLILIAIQMSKPPSKRKIYHFPDLNEKVINQENNEYFPIRDILHRFAEGQNSRKNYTNQTDQKEEGFDDVYKYIMKRRGPLSGVGLGDYIMYIDTTGKNPNDPDALLVPVYSFQHEKDAVSALFNTLNWEKKTIDHLLAINNEHGILFYLIMFLKPKSFGKVTVSGNVHAKPKIYLNYMQENEDLDAGIRFIRFIDRLIATKAFQQVNAKMIHIPDDVCDLNSFGSDDYWKCILKRRTTSFYHLSSTCRMGNNSTTSVVNDKLQIHGLDNVRIADASIMPYTVSGNIHATCVMIGEKCADLVKNHAKGNIRVPNMWTS